MWRQEATPVAPLAIMANLNDVLMGRAKPCGVKRKRRTASSASNAKDAAAKKTRSSVLASWAASPAPNKPITTSITPETKRTATGGLSAPVSSSVSPSKPPRATQSYIDVGQRGFGKHVTCATCGLLYTAGEEEDEREHRAFCKRSKRGIIMAKWKSERLLESFPKHHARMIEIRADDPSAHVKKLLEVKQVLDDALGFVEEHTFLTSRSHFIYVQGRQVVGCVTTERIQEAFLLDPDAPNLVAKVLSPSQRTDTNTAPPSASDSQPAVLGVSQLWVHPSFRRQQIATRMVDAVRGRSIYGMRVAKNQLAFAQPTPSGMQFAEKYLAPSDVLVY